MQLSIHMEYQHHCSLLMQTVIIAFRTLGASTWNVISLYFLKGNHCLTHTISEEDILSQCWRGCPHSSAPTSDKAR